MAYRKPRTNDDDQNKRKFRFRLNLAAAVLHLIGAVFMFVMTDRDAVSPVYIFYANDHRGNATMYGPTEKLLSHARVGYLSAVFLLMAFLDHILVAFPLNDMYEAQLEKHVNKIRWIEYAASASVMHIMIAMLSGVMSLELLTAIAALTVCTMMFGYLQETTNSRFHGKPFKKSMLPFFMGCIPHLTLWLFIVVSFAASASKAPLFVKFVIFGLFITDAQFAVNMWLQQQEIRWWSSYVFGEHVFIVLSLVAKTMLAWTNFGGTASLT
jgi:hypothetical protein